jgi:predicted double-glycine peptidase
MKKIGSILFLFLTLISCNQNNTNNKATSENEKLVKQYFEHFNNHDFVKMANMYAETAAFKDPSLGLEIVKQTKQQTIAKYTELVKIFPDLHDQIIQTYTSSNNHIIVEFISSGTGPDKAKFTLPICTIFTIENGLITKDFTYFDNFEEEKN